MGNYVTEEITTEVDLSVSIMLHNVIKNKFDREYAPLATIQQGLPIEFTVKGASNLYLDLANSHFYVLAKITKADGTSIDPNTALPVNLTLHSMYREISMELNGRNVGDTSQLYPYRSNWETLLNFSKETQETRLICKGWTKDTSGQMGVTALSGNNTGQRSSRGMGEKCRGRAHRSPTPGYVASRTPNSSKRKSPYEIDAISRQLCDQVGSSRSKCGARKFQDGHP